MKSTTLLITAFVLSLAPAISLAQTGGGTVVFSNRVTADNVDAPIYAEDGITRLAGTTHQAGLYAGPTADSLQLVDPPVFFRTGSAAGYMDVGLSASRSISTVEPGRIAFVQIRVWESRFASYELALVGGGTVGTSDVLQIVTGGAGAPPSFPAPLIGLRSFSIGGQRPPIIVSLSSAQLVALGKPLSLEVVAGGSAPLSYQWRKDGTIISGAVQSTLRIASAVLADSGQYEVEVSNAFGQALSGPITVSVLEPARIVVGPQSQTVAQGRTATFTVQGAGSGPLQYQWRKDGVALAGRTEATLELSNVQPGDAGLYTVVVSNAVGSVTSSPAAQLVVVVAPGLVSAPAGVQVNAGQQAIFRVEASGTGPLTYQWRMNGAPLAGQTGAILTLNAVTPGMAGSYSVVVSNAAGEVSSASAVLLVVESGGTVLFNNRVSVVGIDAPIFDEDGQTRLEGENFLAQLWGGASEQQMEPAGAAVVFRSGAAAGYVNVGLSGSRSIGQVVPGAEAHVQIRAWQSGYRTFEEAVAADAKVGQSVVLRIRTGGGGNPPEFPANLVGLQSFSLSRQQAPLIVSRTADLVVLVGQEAVLQVQALGTPVLTYQWRKDGVLIPGAVQSSLRIAAAGPGDGGTYEAEVKNSIGETLSGPILVTVLVPARILQVTSDPSIFVGETTTLTVDAEGTAPLKYEWFEGETGDTSKPSGDNAPSFTTPELAANANYWVRVSNAHGTANSTTIRVTAVKRPQEIAFDPIAPVPFGVPPIALSAVADSGLPVSFAVLSGPGALNGNFLQVLGAGAIVIRASQGGDARYLPASEVDQILLVSKALAGVQISGVSQTFNGAPRPVTVATTPANLAIAVLYNGSPTPPTAAGSYSVTASVVENNFEGSSSATLVIQKAVQTISFAALAPARFGDAPVLLSATSSAGLPVGFEVVSGPGVIAASRVEIRGAGTIVVRAQQAGNANYLAAPAVDQQLVAGKATAVVQLANLQHVFDGTPRNASVTTQPPGLNVTLTYDGGATAPINAGQYLVRATVDDLNYEGSTTGTLVIGKRPQAITWAPLPSLRFGDAPVALSASASSGLKVEFAVISGPAGIVDDILNLSGVGELLVRASQPGDENHLAAPSVEQAVSIGKGLADVIIAGLSHTYDGAGKSAAVTTRPEGLSVALTYNGAAALPVNAGTYDVVATITEANFQGTAQADLVIERAAQTITFAAVPPIRFDDAPVQLIATSSSGLPVGFELVSGPGLLEGNSLRALGAGTIVVRAVQGGDANYLPAPAAVQSILANKAAAQLVLSGLEQVYDGSPRTVTVQTTPIGLPVEVTYDDRAEAPVDAGAYAVSARITDANYDGTANGVLVVNKAPQQITFNPPESARFGDAPIVLSATSSSGLAVTLALVSGPATLQGATLQFNAAGAVVLRATQDGGANHLAATPVDRVIAVNKARALLQITGLQHEYDGQPKAVVVTTQPSGLAVSVTYNGLPDAPAQAGLYQIVATVNDANYEGSVSETMMILGAIAGTVFNDVNGDGEKGADEAGLSDVTVALFGSDATRLIETARTGAQGTYRFAGLLPGGYTLRETDPVGFVSITPNNRTVLLTGSGFATADFADQPVGQVGGFVFEDANGDGVRDPDEPGLPGVTITLIGTERSRTATTDAKGGYVFVGVEAGRYTVEETDPAGFTSSTPNQRAVTLDIGSSASVNFGDQAVGTIAGIVFTDQNGNGVQDRNESGLADVVITLSGNGQNLTMPSRADGSYVFSGLTPGSYVIVETDPAGFTSTTPNRRQLNLGSGGAATANFGDQAVGIISGLVYEDLNGNGIREAGERGIPSVLVTLTGAERSVEALTGTEGTFTFESVVPGNYIVAETDPSGFTSTTPNQRAVSLASGGSATASFGDQAVGTVSGLAFEDTNSNGIREPGEPGLSGIAVSLIGDVVTNSRTAADGSYSFAGVVPGAYVVRITEPEGFTPTTPTRRNVSLGSGGAAVANFGLQAVGTISGLVFEDSNGNGLRDPNEAGIASVNITLTGPDGVLIVSTTGDGSFLFTSLTPGTYTVVETDPGGFTSTTANQRAINLVSGGAATANFGDQPVGAITGNVFADANGNGSRDASESGLGLVTVRLYESDGFTLVSRTFSSSDGAFSFADMVPGSYSIEAEDPVGFISTTSNRRTVNLAAGGAATAVFGKQATATISGAVFEDTNGNGSRDVGEVGIGRVVVRLFGADSALVKQAATSSDGSYTFSGIVPSNYNVEEEDPIGFASTTPNRRAVSLASGGAASANFGDQAVGTVSGAVFEDLNANGLRDANEPGLGGVEVKLTGVDRTLTKRTSGDGSYSFDEVTPGTYAIEETDPTGFTSTTPNRRTVNLPSGGAATASFGDQASGTVSGYVFEDLNGNGQRDGGEAGIGGAAVKLETSTGTLQTGTAGDGSYQFTAVQPGSYIIEETDPPGFSSTSPNRRTIALASGGAAIANFGDQASGTISGSVFEDSNGNGAREAGEPGIGLVLIRLLSSDGSTLLTQSATANDGSFDFRGIPPGIYVVEEVDPAGFTSTTANRRTVSLSSNGASTASFGDQASGTISGIVFDDANGNGQRDSGEPGIAGVTVTLIGDNTNASTTTQGDGSYGFSGVIPGGYTIEATALPGFVSTTPARRTLSLSSGGAATANFGEQAVQTIVGAIFEDQNGNGRQDAGEPGLSGVVVLLLKLSDESEVARTTTSLNGTFVFANVPSGQYTVRELVPTAYTVTAAPGGNRASLSSPEPGVADQPVQLNDAGAVGLSFGNNVVGTISGSVFDDLDGNGSPGAGEGGIGGAMIDLLTLGGSVLQTAESTGSGVYQFANVPPADYQVRQRLVTGYTLAVSTQAVRIAPSGAATANFANRAAGTVSGLVFNDENGNGVRDAGEAGVGGAAVKLVNRTSAQTLTMSTSGDGAFLFQAVQGGTLDVSVTDPEGFTTTTPSTVALQFAAGSSASVSFGERLNYSAPSITKQPISQTVNPGVDVTLRVVAEGEAPVTYQWRKNGTDVPGATSPDLVLRNVTTREQGDYTVAVSNRGGTVVSQIAAVRVLGTDRFGQWAISVGLPANAMGPADDPDGDGQQNLMEYALGTNPTVPADDGRPVMQVVREGGQLHLSLAFQRPRNAGGIQYLLLASPDLVTWTEVPAVATVVEDLNATTEFVRLTEVQPVGDTRIRFLRLMVAEAADQSAEPALAVIPTSAGILLGVEGDSGARFLIEASENLVDWRTFRVLSNISGPMEVLDGESSAVRIRFYRVKQVE